MARSHEILAACVPPDRQGRPLDPTKEAALAAGVPVVQRKSYKSAEAAGELRPERADVGVLAYVTQIIPSSILDAPKHASVCFHPSLLPRYRGGSAINWQLINGETVGGITLFRPDDGIDEGPIYLQQELAIGPDETAGSYYYGAVFEPGVAATVEAVEMLLAGVAKAVPQDESRASYEPLCRDEHAGIDWSKPASVVHNLIRGCDPSPGAHCKLGERRLRLYGSRRVSRETPAGAGPGTVLAIGEAGVEISTGDSSIRVSKLSVGGPKLAARAAAAEIGLEAGLRLGSA